jgi:hypothetical protein
VGDAIDDIIPSRRSVINMLLHLQQVESHISSLSSRTEATLSRPSPPSLLLPTAQSLGATLNKLAAAAQAVLRSSASETVPDLSLKIQHHAQSTGRAVKSLSTLLKSDVVADPPANQTPPRDQMQLTVQHNPLPQDPYSDADDDYV